MILEIIAASTPGSRASSLSDRSSPYASLTKSPTLTSFITPLLFVMNIYIMVESITYFIAFIDFTFYSWNDPAYITYIAFC